MKLLFLGKDREDFYFQKAMDFISQNFDDYLVVLAKKGEALPEKVATWKGDYLVSYLCPWVIPSTLLDAVRIASINFHPGPPNYPGSGCTNFAIYNEENEYGVTCHHMAAEVDSGKIIAVKRFQLLETDSVYSVTQRCYAYMLVLFYEMMTRIKTDQPLPVSEEKWTRKAYRYKDLQELRRIDPKMNAKEIRRRIRAVTYPGYKGAYIELNGEMFEYRENE